MDTSVLMEIENLRRPSLADLRTKFLEVFQEERRCRNREHLFRRIAWRLQALTEGDLSERARARAQEIARDADLLVVAPRSFFSVESTLVQTTPSDNRPPNQDRRLPIPGETKTLLSRKWKGRTLLVEVQAQGFRYENRHYPSLSAVALAITGTRWNGLAFFGLTRQPVGSPKEQTHAEQYRESKGTDHSPARLRCAIYTRKSTEEGLDQDLNSLDALTGVLTQSMPPAVERVLTHTPALTENADQLAAFLLLCIHHGPLLAPFALFVAHVSLCEAIRGLAQWG